MDSPESRKSLYDAVSGSVDIGDFKTFESKISPTEKVIAPALSEKEKEESGFGVGSFERQLQKNLHSPFTRLATFIAGEEPPVIGGITRTLDLPFNLIVGGAQAGGEELGKAGEALQKGAVGEAALRVAVAGGRTAIGTAMGVTPAGLAFGAGGETLEAVSPEIAETVGKALTPVTSITQPTGGAAQPLAELADLTFQAALFGFGNKVAGKLKTKILENKPLTPSEQKIFDGVKAEKSQAKPDIEKAIRDAGAEPVGTREGLVYFNDPKTKSTLVLKEGDVSPEAIAKKLETSRAKFETLPKSFRQTVIKELGGKDVETRFGKVGDLSDTDLIRIAEERKVRTEAPKSEAPISQGGDITVRGEANAEQIRRFQEQGKIKPAIEEKFEPSNHAEKKLGEVVDKNIVEPPQAGLAAGILPIAPREKPVKTLSYSEEQIKFDPTVEKRYSESHGVKPEPTTGRVREFITRLKERATREFEHLPKTGEFAELRFGLNKLAKQKGVASDRTVRAMQGVTADLNSTQFSLFERKILLDDLLFDAGKDRPLPFGFTKETLAQEHAKITGLTAKDQQVAGAVGRRREFNQAVRDSYVKALDDIGFDVSDRFKNDDYFRHQVLMYANSKGVTGVGKKLKTPTGRSFLKRRTGSEYDINTSYLEAEHEFTAQMLHDVEVAKTIKLVSDKYSIHDKVAKDAKAKGVEFEEAIPEGYTAWQPREGNVFYLADSIPAKLAAELESGILKQAGIGADDISKVLVFGQKRRQFVVKNEVAQTLDNLVKSKPESIVFDVDRKILSAWKEWQLISPRRIAKYNFRNVSGDADAAFVGNPSTFSKVPQAVKELYHVFYKDGAMTETMKDWFERGGFQTTLQAQELGDLKRFSVFKHINDTKTPIAELPAKGFKKYWETARLATDFRESVLRYSAYLDYHEQLKSGKLKNYGASLKDEVNALPDVRDKAFKLSNDLLGAYDEVGVTGQALRRYLFPFWSWKEVNMRRYSRFFKNAMDDQQLTSAIGRKAVGTAVKLPYNAYRVGKFVVKATAFWTTLQAWNHLMFPEAEASLDKDTQSSPHIIFGVDDKGKAIVFTRMGALGDFLEWFGMDEFPRQFDEWMTNKKTLKDIAVDMAKSPVNVFVQGSAPQFKVPAEALTGKSLFPDAFKPRAIRDTGLYLAQSLGLQAEYKELMGLPAPEYNTTMRDFFFYSIDPNQSGFSDVMEEKRRFMERVGKSSEGGYFSPKSNALYNYKLSLRYKDTEKAEKFLGEYLKLGGTREGLKRSMQSLDPLHGLNDQEKKLFISQLDEEGRKDLVRAINFYVNVLRP